MNIEFEEYPSVEETEETPRRLGGTDVLRGAMVVGTAIIVGAVLLIGGLGGDDESGLTSAIAVDDSEAQSGDTENPDGSEGDDEVAVADGTFFDPMDPFPIDPGDDSDSEIPSELGQPAPDAATDADTVTGGADLGMSAEGAGDGDNGNNSDEAAVSTPIDDTTDNTAGSEVLPSEDTTGALPGVAAATESAVRLPAEVKVLVLNGVGTPGLAARGAAIAESAGYAIATPKNAEPTPQASGIYFVEGYQREALDVAQAYGNALDALLKPLTADNAPIANTQSAHVIVVVGSDRAIEVP